MSTIDISAYPKVLLSFAQLLRITVASAELVDEARLADTPHSNAFESPLLHFASGFRTNAMLVAFDGRTSI